MIVFEQTGSVTLKIQAVKEEDKEATLLASKGWFYMRDIFKVLDPDDQGLYKLAFKQVERVILKGQDPYEVLGHQKEGGRVLVLMEKFAPWYRSNLIFKARRVPEGLALPELLQSSGHYYRLSEICNHYGESIPYTYGMLKRHAEKEPDALKKMGLVKADTTYLVEPKAFSEWLRKQFS